MIQKITYTKLSLIALLFFSIFSVQTYTNISFGGIAAEWVLSCFQLYVFFVIIKRYCSVSQYNTLKPVTFYLGWNIVSILYGILTAEIYWDWRALIIHSFGLLLPVVTYSLTNADYFKRFINFYLYKILPFFAIIALIILPDGYGFYLVPVSFLLVFFAILNNKWKMILLGLTVFVIFSDLGARSSVIKFALPLIFSLGFYFRKFLTLKLFNSVRLILLTIPILFFTLGVTEVFNVFNINEYISGEYTKPKESLDGEEGQDDLKADTRTFLYEEVLSSAVNNSYWLVGRSPARGNDSKYFGWENSVTGRHERAGNEVGILNVFTWTGLIGVILYFFVFARGSYLAINASNNFYCKLVGLYLSFRWCYAWVEDINGFTLNYFMIWSIIAFCFSLELRSMTDDEMESWIRSLFDKNRELIRK